MIKKYSGFITLSLLCLVLVLIFIYGPKSYDWTVTFDHDDDQPFGCSIFDDVMTRSLSNGYNVQDDYTKDIDPKTYAIIYTKHEISIDDYRSVDSTAKAQELNRAKQLVRFVKDGGFLILATGHLSDYSSGKLHEAYDLESEGVMHKTEANFSDFSDFMQDCRKYKQYRLNCKWIPNGSTIGVQPFMLYFHKMADYYNPHLHKPLMAYFNKELETNFTVAYYKKLGKGMIYYVSVPLFFTNYGVMDENASKITNYLLSPVANRHVVRIMGKNKEVAAQEDMENHSEFRYLLSRPALKWALYLAMIVLALFCFFTARRKMRAIPLPPESTNSTLEFAKYMGTYYFARHQHSKPVIAEYKSLLQEINDYYGWDTESMSNQDLADGIAAKTGEDSDTILHLIRIVNSLDHDHVIEQKDMIEMIDYIVFIKNKL